MKRRDLEAPLRALGVVLLREGGSHRNWDDGSDPSGSSSRGSEVTSPAGSTRTIGTNTRDGRVDIKRKSVV